MKIRKFVPLIFVICILFSLTACKNNEKTSETPTDITKNFFSAFETSDYETMKDFCTEECIQSYFHDNDVDGMISAKLTEIGDEELTDDNTVSILVSVEMETAEVSALYPETETSFYVKLVQDDNSSWLIDSFPTGK